MKKAVIRRIFIWANATLTPLIGAGVMHAYHQLPPEMQAMADPWALTTVAVGLVAGAMSWGLAKWQGIPVEEIQTWLADKGLYAGRIDGLAGDQTKAALARAVEDPDVHFPEPTVKGPRKFQRPQGSKTRD
jgi:hypothetical protein